jgi:hypothetical protein
LQTGDGEALAVLSISPIAPVPDGFDPGCSPLLPEAHAPSSAIVTATSAALAYLL